MQKAIHGITVSHFYDTYREKLKLELVTGTLGSIGSFARGA